MSKVDYSRSVVTSTVHAAEITVVDGKPITAILPDITHIGKIKLSDEKAAKLLKEEYKGKVVVVTGVDAKEEVRGMDFETFMKYSVPVERPASQQKKNDSETKA